MKIQLEKKKRILLIWLLRLPGLFVGKKNPMKSTCAVKKDTIINVSSSK